MLHKCWFPPPFLLVNMDSLISVFWSWLLNVLCSINYTRIQAHISTSCLQYLKSALLKSQLHRVVSSSDQSREKVNSSMILFTCKLRKSIKLPMKSIDLENSQPSGHKHYWATTLCLAMSWKWATVLQWLKISVCSRNKDRILDSQGLASPGGRNECSDLVPFVHYPVNRYLCQTPAPSPPFQPC